PRHPVLATRRALAMYGAKVSRSFSACSADSSGSEVAWARLKRTVSDASVPSKSAVRTRRISLAMFTLFIIRGLCRSHLNIRFRIILDFANVDLRIVFIDLFAFIAIGTEDVPNDIPEQ